jgi:hypothetical protein
MRPRPPENGTRSALGDATSSPDVGPRGRSGCCRPFTGRHNRCTRCRGSHVVRNELTQRLRLLVHHAPGRQYPRRQIVTTGFFEHLSHMPREAGEMGVDRLSTVCTPLQLPPARRLADSSHTCSLQT